MVSQESVPRFSEFLGPEKAVFTKQLEAYNFRLLTNMVENI